MDFETRIRTSSFILPNMLTWILKYHIATLFCEESRCFTSNRLKRVIYIGLNARDAMTFWPHMLSFSQEESYFRNFILSQMDAPVWSVSLST